jgi:hypothetical protein
MLAARSYLSAFLLNASARSFMTLKRHRARLGSAGPLRPRLEDVPHYGGRRISSGSFAIFAAIRRASSPLHKRICFRPLSPHQLG